MGTSIEVLSKGRSDVTTQEVQGTRPGPGDCSRRGPEPGLRAREVRDGFSGHVVTRAFGSADHSAREDGEKKEC